jgi:hypothetical protein
MIGLWIQYTRLLTYYSVRSEILSFFSPLWPVILVVSDMYGRWQWLSDSFCRYEAVERYRRFVRYFSLALYRQKKVSIKAFFQSYLNCVACIYSEIMIKCFSRAQMSNIRVDQLKDYL